MCAILGTRKCNANNNKYLAIALRRRLRWLSWMVSLKSRLSSRTQLSCDAQESAHVLTISHLVFSVTASALRADFRTVLDETVGTIVMNEFSSMDYAEVLLH